jgi:histidinol phosphatase-like PHP family hydrolase
VLANDQIGELLALASEEAEGQKEKALRKASRAAYLWPVEAVEVLEAEGSLLGLPRVGPFIARYIEGWINDPPEIPEPPEVRRGFMTLAHARAVTAAHPELVAKMKSDLQMHSTYSDGHASIAEMARAAMDLGHDYIGITDHSKGLKIAGGMDEETLILQMREIDELNEQLDSMDSEFRVLRSLEMNIKPDGTGDMEPEVLAELDLVLGSFHSKLRIKEDQTDRYIASISNPDTQVLGHPRGRQYNFRTGLYANWDKVFLAAAERGKAVEIDCHPNRQDLNVELSKMAVEAGAYFSIGTDAHSEAEMNFIDIGLATVFDAGVPADRVLNFLPAEEVIAWARESRAAV